MRSDDGTDAAPQIHAELLPRAKPPNGPLPSPTFLPSPPLHYPSPLLTEYPTLGSLLQSTPLTLTPTSTDSPSPARTSNGPTAIFSPALHPTHPPTAASLSLPSLPPTQPAQPRPNHPLPTQWVNSDSDYVPLLPIAAIALLSAWVFWLCLPSHQQFLSSFSVSPSHLTVFHHWQSPHNLPPLPHPSTLPAPHIFVGRHQQLTALHSALTTQHTVTLIGPPGSGRTALIHTYVDRYIVQSATSPPYNLILHVSASSIHAVHADLTLFAASLQLPLLHPAASSLTATLHAFLAGWPRYLVVFDGVQSSSQRKELEALLPRRKGKENEGLLGDTIFVVDQAHSSPPANQVVRLTGLGKRQCVRLLSAVSGVEAVNETAVEAQELCERLDRLPQAAVLAALYMRGQQVTSFAAVTAALQAMREKSESAVQAMIRVVLALPAFEESLPALSALGRLTNYSSSVPAALLPVSFPLTLYVEYGLMWAPQWSTPYAALHTFLFSSTETKTASVLLLRQLSTVLCSPPYSSLSSQSDAEQRMWSAVASSGLLDTLAVAALGQWMHRPLYSNVTIVLPAGAPSMSPATLPGLPSLSLSSWYKWPTSSVPKVQRVWGGHSAPREAVYSVAQAAAFMPVVLAVLRPIEHRYDDVTLHVTADSAQTIAVTPNGQSLSLSTRYYISSPLRSLLITAACYLADVHADRQLSSRYLTIAAAIALQGGDHNDIAQSLLLLSVHHLLVDDRLNAVSLLTYLHQRYIAPASPAVNLSHWQQANILSALAFAYARAGDLSESERLLQEALTSRQQIEDRSSIAHLLSCRDLLLVREWQSAPIDAQMNAQHACQRIEHSVFTASSYAASSRLLAIAVLLHPTNASAAAPYSLAAYETFATTSASTPDHRLPLTLLYHAHHLYTAHHPHSHPHSAMPLLDHLFLQLAASYPRGLGCHTRGLLLVSAEVAAGLGVWAQGMEASRQGWEASRGAGDGRAEEEWKRMFGWLYQRSEQDKAEERRREEQARLDELKRKHAEEREQSALSREL